MRTVSGGKWTIDRRWVVVGTWTASWGVFPDVILFDPDSGDPHVDILECHAWIAGRSDG